MYTITEYQIQQLRNRYPNDELIQEIQRQPQLGIPMTPFKRYWTKIKTMSISDILDDFGIASDMSNINLLAIYIRQEELIKIILYLRYNNTKNMTLKQCKEYIDNLTITKD